MRLFFFVVLQLTCGFLSFGVGKADPMEAQPIENKPYSAELLIVPGGADPEDMKVYVDGPKTRLEIKEGDATQPTIEITREDQKKIYYLFPNEKLNERPLTDKTMDPQIHLVHFASGKFQDIGSEGPGVVTMYKVTLTNGQSLCLWINISSHLPLKMADSGATVFFKDFAYGDQDPALFDPKVNFKPSP